MDNNNIVKKDLLRRKIEEYFSKNPKAKSLIVKADAGPTKTVWKVMREGNSYNVVEVNTLREEFTLTSEDEDEKKKFKDYDPDKTNVARGKPLGPMSLDKLPTPKEPIDAQKARRKAQATKHFSREHPADYARITGQDTPSYNPAPPGGTVSGASVSPPQKLNPLSSNPANANVAGTGAPATPSHKSLDPELQNWSDWNPTSGNNKFSQELMKTNSFKAAALSMPDDEFYRSFKDFGATNKSELDDDVVARARAFYSQHNPQLAQVGESLVKARPLTNAKRALGKILREDPAFQKKNVAGPFPSDGPEGGNVELSEPEPESPEKKKTEEVAAVSRTLQGQTIKEAKVNVTQEGGSLSLTLINALVPATLEWSRSGKVVYTFNGVAYIIKREQDETNGNIS